MQIHICTYRQLYLHTREHKHEYTHRVGKKELQIVMKNQGYIQIFAYVCMLDNIFLYYHYSGCAKEVAEHENTCGKQTKYILPAIIAVYWILERKIENTLLWFSQRQIQTQRQNNAIS